MDLFAGLDGITAKNEPKSLAEKQRLAESQKAKQSEWINFNMLSSASPNMQSLTSGINSASNSAANSDPFDNLPTLPPKSSSEPTTRMSSVAPQSSSLTGTAPTPSLPPKKRAENDVSLSHPLSTGGDDFGDFGDFASPPPPSGSGFSNVSSTATSQRKSESYRDDVLESSASRDQSRRYRESHRDSYDLPPRPPRERSFPEISDKSIAQMIDMGFDIPDAKRALAAMDGSVSGAVSWLMAEAQGRPLPTPRRKGDEWDQFGQVASDLGKSVFATASSLWSKGRKELSKAYNEYAGPSSNGSSYDSRSFGSSAESPRWSDGFNSSSSNGRRQTHQNDRFTDDFTDSLPPRPTRVRQPGSTADSSSHTPPADRKPDGPAPTKSRADIFRERLAQRKNSPGSGRSSPAASGTPPASAAASMSHSSHPSSPSTPEVDLLNLNGPAQVASVGGAVGDMLTSARKAGTEAFARGDYEGSVDAFTQALAAAPQGHPLRSVLYSNRAAAYLKTGNTRGAFDDANDGIALIDPETKGKGQELEAGKTLHDVWAKLMTRRAQAAENLEKFQEALDSWQLLLDGGHASPTALAAKRRCQKALHPDIERQANAQPDANKSQRRGWGKSANGPTTSAGKAALEKVRREHRSEEAEGAEREKLRVVITSRVDNWKAGHESDLRALLSTLHTVLWQGSGWQPVQSADLVVPKKVRIAYMKAVARTHPDKVAASAPLENRMVAESVFIVIQKAWEQFRQDNGL